MSIQTKAQYEHNLNDVAKKNNFFAIISTHLLKKLAKGEKLKPTKEFCAEIFVSTSTMSNFIKVIGLSNYKELIFIHNLSIETNNNAENEVKKPAGKELSEKNYSEAGKLIEWARKVFFLGVSSNHFANLDLAVKLQRIDKWVVVPSGKYEQVGLSKLLTEDDLIICSSISLQHSWMVNILKKTKSRIILVSAIIPESIDLKVDLFYFLNADERNDRYRIKTEKNRILLIEFFDNVFDTLLLNKRYANNLLNSSYVAWEDSILKLSKK